MSSYIGRMPFLWLSVDDQPGPRSDRGILERNCIGLLSNVDKANVIDRPGGTWLGRFSVRQTVRHSGLWNQNHVAEQYDMAQIERIFQRYLNL